MVSSTKNLTLWTNFILYVIALLFSVFSLIVQRMLCTSLCFLPNTQTGFQTLDYEVVVIIRKVMKHHRNFLLCFISQNENAMRTPLIFLCVMVEILDLKGVLLFIRVFINSCLHMWQIFCSLFSFPFFFFNFSLIFLCQRFLFSHSRLFLLFALVGFHKTYL